MQAKDLRIGHAFRSRNNKIRRHMKKVLAIKTPIGGIVQIIPRENSETAVGLSWRETILSEVEKEASRLSRTGTSVRKRRLQPLPLLALLGTRSYPGIGC